MNQLSSFVAACSDAVGTAAVVGAVGVHLGAAVADLPAVRVAVIDALDALRHLEALPVEDDDVSCFHALGHYK